MKQVVFNVSLHKNQNPIYDACMDKNLRTVAVCAGRKFGKTFLSLNVLLTWALDSPEGILGYYVPNYPYLKHILKEARVIIPPGLIKGGSWDNGYRKSDKTLTLINDCDIIFKSMHEPDSARPLSLQGLVAEEFSLWGEYAWEECVSPTLIHYKAPMLAIYTARLKNFVYDWEKQERDDHKVFHYTSYDGLESKEEVDRYASTKSPGVIQTEVMAEWIDDYGGVFGELEHLFDSSLPDETAALLGRRYVAGVDLGRVNDMTAITILDTETMQGVFRKVFNGIEYTVQAKIIEAILRRYNNPLTCIDNTGELGGVYKLLKKKNLNVKSIVYTNKRKVNMIDSLRIAISNKDFLLPHWGIYFDELAKFEVQETKSGKITYNAPDGKNNHDDCVNSLALCWKAYQMLVGYVGGDKPTLGGKRTGASNNTNKH